MLVQLLLVASLLLGARAALNTSHCIDVRDFGARGDGATDDSDAIQAAVHAAIDGQKKMVVGRPWEAGKPTRHPLVGGPDLCFSPGDYKVTRTIELSPNIHGGGWGRYGTWAPATPPNVRGLGKVNVRLNSTTIDMFSTISAFYWHFTGVRLA